MWNGKRDSNEGAELKVRLVQEAVDDNIAAIRGSLPRPLRRGTRVVRRWGPRAVAAGFLLALAIGLRSLPRTRAIAAAPTSPSLPAQPDASRAGPPDTPLVRSQRLSVAALALGIRRIVIDAGHGGKSLGTSSATGLHEKDVTVDIAERLGRRLEKQGMAVSMTREHDDTLSLEERSDIANNSRGDLFLSIHVNSLPPDTRGVETYYLGPSAAPSVDAVAANENRDSGYSMTDLRALIDMIYSDARKDESYRFATAIHHALIQDLRRVNPSLEDRGVKTAPFVVLAATRMPAVLAEVSCLSNTEEAELLSGPEYKQSIADALYDGIEAYLHHGVLHRQKETRNGS